MKKLLSATLVVLLAGCSASKPVSSVKPTETPEPTPETTPETTTEVEVVEQLTINNPIQLKTKTLQMSGYQWLNDPNPAFEQITMKESLRLYEEGGTGIIFYSYDTCPWCNRAVPVLNQAAKELGVKSYYVDVYEPEVTEDLVQQLFTDVDEILSHEKSEKTGNIEPVFYTPEVIAVKDGKIVSHHTALVDSFELQDEDDQMSEEENEELKKIYQDMIRSIAD